MAHPNLKRRSIIKLTAGLGAIRTAFATTGSIAQADSHVSAPMAGQVTVHKLGPVILHSYIAPDTSAMVTPTSSKPRQSCV